MKKATVVRHVAFEDLGTLAPALAAHGYAVTYVEAGMTPLDDIDPGAPDLVVVLGGPISANDVGDYPFLEDELRLLDARLALDRPTLGICLGAQLMARALGARVYRAAEKEIGWMPIELSPEGRRHPLRHVGGDVCRVFHWHGETFDLPSGATLLASTPCCAHQAFSFGARALGLQFHPEVTVAGLERWLIGHTGEIAATPGLRVADLRREAARWGADLGQRAARLWDAWLGSLVHP